ncbi:MAG TPA: metallophosphoesterase [Kiritimatiellia bacterium]|nr:metallophosphoesterase [Kiritimatiellia bacterium]
MNSSRHAPLTRRNFLRLTAAGTAGFATGWPLHRAWTLPAGTADLRLTFFTDIHARVEWDTPEAMHLAAQAINAQASDLVLCGGDCITDGFQSTSQAIAPRWQAYMEMHRAIHSEPYTILGNHDLVGVEPADGSPPAADPRADFLHHFNLEQTWRTFEAGGCRFFLLDSIDPTGDDLRYRGWISEAQRQWMSDTLARVDSHTPIIVLTHMPLMTSFFQATAGLDQPVPSNRGVVNNLQTLDLFTHHNLILVLQGHLHVSEMLTWNHTTFITGGAVCGKWWRGPWYGTPEGFGTITLRGRHVTWDYHTYGWQARRPPHQ